MSEFLSEFITKKKLGTILINKGFATEDQIEECLKEQQETREFLGEILLKRGIVNQNQLLETLAEQLDMEFVSIDVIKTGLNSLQAEALEIFPYDFAAQHGVCLYKVDDRTDEYFVLTSNPMDQDIRETVEKMTTKSVILTVATREDVVKACDIYKNLSLKILRKYFIAALNGGEPEVNILLEKVDHPKYIPLLLQLLEKHTNPTCRKEIVQAIGKLRYKDKMVVDTLQKLMEIEGDPVVKKSIELVIKILQ